VQSAASETKPWREERVRPAVAFASSGRRATSTHDETATASMAEAREGADEHDTQHAQKVKGSRCLHEKTDRIDEGVLADDARRDLVSAIRLPDLRVRGERDRARWRLHLVRHRSSSTRRCRRSTDATIRSTSRIRSVSRD
jgi:hypothetical protein